MENKTIYLILAAITITILGVGGWYYIISPNQEFQVEIEYYTLLTEQHQSIIKLEYDDGVLHENRVDGEFRVICQSHEKDEFKLFVDEEVENADYYKVWIKIDRKNKAIILYDILKYHYWSPHTPAGYHTIESK